MENHRQSQRQQKVESYSWRWRYLQPATSPAVHHIFVTYFNILHIIIEKLLVLQWIFGISVFVFSEELDVLFLLLLVAHKQPCRACRCPASLPDRNTKATWNNRRRNGKYRFRYTVAVHSLAYDKLATFYFSPACDIWAIFFICSLLCSMSAGFEMILSARYSQSGLQHCCIM